MFMRRVDDAEEYRKRAEHCLDVAGELTTTRPKLAVLDMAMSWLRLAEQAVKNRRIATPNLMRAETHRTRSSDAN